MNKIKNFVNRFNNYYQGINWAVCSNRSRKDERNQLPKDLSQINLLLVNDSIPNLYAQEKYFKEKGFHTYSALDGDIALRTFEYAPVGYFSVILTDIWMNRMNGDKMAESIRKLDRQDADKVIIIADQGPYTGAEILDFKKSGIDGFLKKVRDLSALNDVLQEIRQ